MNLIIKVNPDEEKARSILKSSEITLERIAETNESKFPSNIIKEYYEVIREFISAILILDGYKATGENAHKVQIEYFRKNYEILVDEEIVLINELRITRNNISYEGLQITVDYLKSKITEIKLVIDKLKKILVLKLGKL
jgi:hypothetical protein